MITDRDAQPLERMQVGGIRSERQATGERLRRWRPLLDPTGLTENKRMSKRFVVVEVELGFWIITNVGGHPLILHNPIFWGAPLSKLGTRLTE